MNSSEKVAWIELIVSVSAIVLVAALYPWLGGGAAGGFGLLGLLGITPLFMRKRAGQVISDERDRLIEQRSSLLGCGAAWVLMMLSLTAITMWHADQPQGVSPAILNSLIFIQLAFCFLIKGASTLIQYRGSHYAA